MSRRRIFLFVSALVIAVALVSGGVWTGAERTTSAQDTEGDLEEFRSELAAWYGDLAEAYPYVVEAGGEPDVLPLIHGAQQMIPELTDEDLAILRDAFAENPALWALPEMAQSAFGPEAQASRAKTEGAQDHGGGVSNVGRSCPTGDDLVQEYVLKGLAILAQGVIEALPTDGITIAARLVPVAFWVVAEEVALAIEATNAYAADCEGDVDSGLLRDHLDADVSTRASPDDLNTQTGEITGAVNDRADEIIGAVNERAGEITGAVNERAGEIIGAVADHNTHLDARADEIIGAVGDHNTHVDEMFIEENLADCTMLVSLYLPAAHGGYLEVVLDLVDGWITASEAAELYIGNAQSNYDQAVVDIANGDYKEAYASLCSAYNGLSSTAAPPTPTPVPPKTGSDRR